MSFIKDLVSEASRLLAEESSSGRYFIYDLASGKALITGDKSKALAAVSRSDTVSIDFVNGIQFMKNGRDVNIGVHPFYVFGFFTKRAKGMKYRHRVDEELDFSDGELFAFDVRNNLLLKSRMR